MNAAALLLVAASVGVEIGWEPTESGDLVYIIQLDEVLAESLKEGQVIESEIHPSVRGAGGVRRFRILVGGETPPRIAATPPEENATESAAAAADPENTRPADAANSPPADTGAAGEVLAAPPRESGIQLRNGADTSEMAPPPDRFERPEPGGRGGTFTPGGGAFQPRDSRPADDAVSPLAPPNPENPGLQGGPGNGESETPRRAPDLLPSERDPRPIGNRRADYIEAESAPAGAPDASTSAPVSLEKPRLPKAPAEPAKPWMPLMAAMLLLVMSVSLNGYLGWIARDFYRRYRELALQG